MSLLATVSSAALTANAVAADMRMPVKAPPPVAPVVTWSGPYAGISLGAALDESRFDGLDRFFFCCPVAPTTSSWKNTHAAFAAGGLVGYNWQIGSWVLGLEGDWNWVTGKASASIPSTLAVVASSELKWMSTCGGGWGIPNAYDPLVRDRRRRLGPLLRFLGLPDLRGQLHGFRRLYPNRLDRRRRRRAHVHATLDSSR